MVFNSISFFFHPFYLIQSHLQSEEALGEERERDLDSLGGGHILRGLDSIGGGNLLRAIYRGTYLV